MLKYTKIILLSFSIFVIAQLEANSNTCVFNCKNDQEESSTSKEKIQSENIKEIEEENQPVSNAPEGWLYGLEKDGERRTPYFDGWVGSEVRHKNDIRWSQGSEPVRKGDKSIRFNIGRGEGRCSPWDCKHGFDMVQLDDNNPLRQDDLYDTLDQIQGEDFWYFFSVFIPKDFPDTFNENINWDESWDWGKKSFLKGLFKLISINPIAIGCLPGVKHMELAEVFLEKGNINVAYFPNHGDSKSIMKIDDMRDKWTDILIHINYDIEDGSIAFWVNGELSYEKNITKGIYDQNRLWDDADVYEPDKRFFEANEDFWDFGDSSIDECDYIMVTSFGGTRVGVNHKDHVDIAKNIPASVIYYDEVRIGSTREEVDIVSFPNLSALH
jgi:hypothetical protein